MLHVIGSAFAPSRATGSVTVRSDDPNFPRAFEELKSTDAKNAGLAYAATQGVANPRINGNIVGPYPVNADGVSLDEVKVPPGTPPDDPRLQPWRYQIDVPVAAPIL